MVLTALSLTVVLIAAVTDLATGKVYNRLTYTAAGLGLVLHALPIPGAQGVLFALGGLGAGFALLLLPFLLGGTGGGDVKLLAALGAFVGAEAIAIVLFLTCLAGLVWIAGQYVWLVTGQSHAAWREGVRDRSLRLPFAVCIAAGVVVWALPTVSGLSALAV